MVQTSKNSYGVEKFFQGYSDTWNSLYGRDSSKNPFLKFSDHKLRRVLKTRFAKVMELASSSDVKTVLDAGCGSGQYLVDFAKLGKRVTGIDFAPSMLELAAESLKANNFSKGVELIQGDFYKHKFDGKFDAVCAIGFFDYQSDPVAQLKKMVELANVHVYASFPKARHYLAPQRKLRYKIRQCPLWLYSRKRLNQILSDCGVDGVTEVFDLGRDYLVCVNVRKSPHR